MAKRLGCIESKRAEGTADVASRPSLDGSRRLPGGGGMSTWKQDFNKRENWVHC